MRKGKLKIEISVTGVAVFADETVTMIKFVAKGNLMRYKINLLNEICNRYRKIRPDFLCFQVSPGTGWGEVWVGDAYADGHLDVLDKLQRNELKYCFSERKTIEVN